MISEGLTSLGGIPKDKDLGLEEPYLTPLDQK